MISFLGFIGVMALLWIEGVLVARTALCMRDRVLVASLALPLATLCNTFVIFLYTVVHIPLTRLTILGAHVLLCVALWFVQKRKNTPALTTERMQRPSKWVSLAFVLFGTIAMAFSITHALVLPSANIDSFTNWTMRSKISYMDHTLAFDTTEVRGIAKPQYPPLFHALQITANQGQPKWSDRAANGATWLLTMSLLVALGMLIARLRTSDHALIALTLLLQLPLFTIHLSQGYGDLPLTLFAAASFVALATAVVKNDKHFLLLSAVLVSAGMWAKIEGLVGLWLPWAATLVFMRKELKLTKKELALWAFGTFATYAPYMILLKMLNLPLTPHGSDSSFAIHWDGIAALPRALFGSGSLTVLWTALLLVIPSMFVALKQQHPLLDRSMSKLALCGILCFALVIATYIFTPNVAFFLNGQSFYRQLLTPAALLIVWCVLMVKAKQID